MVLNENRRDLDVSFTIEHNDYNYQMYTTTQVFTCYTCNQHGHLRRDCPGNPEETNSASNENTVLPEGLESLPSSEGQQSLPSQHSHPAETSDADAGFTVITRNKHRSVYLIIK